MAKTTKMVEVTLNKLKPYDKNAKKHGSEQIELLKKSIKEFGFLSPCLIDEDFNIIAGHGRVEACKELGIEEVPCVFVEGLTDEQRRAYIIADNRLTELGEWDMDIVHSELSDLSDLNFDVSVTGFDFDMDIDTGSFDEDKYTSVVNIPQYTPSTEYVPLLDCLDYDKYTEMIEEIDASDVNEEEKFFLRMAAGRHVSFNYKKIADYYASAGEEMQKLMERSALVIIDVGDAIKYGYAQLQSYLDEIEERENGER